LTLFPEYEELTDWGDLKLDSIEESCVTLNVAGNKITFLIDMFICHYLPWTHFLGPDPPHGNRWTALTESLFFPVYLITGDEFVLTLSWYSLHVPSCS
jgi:hypothetical protein